MWWGVVGGGGGDDGLGVGGGDEGGFGGGSGVGVGGGGCGSSGGHGGCGGGEGVEKVVADPIFHGCRGLQRRAYHQWPPLRHSTKLAQVFIVLQIPIPSTRMSHHLETERGGYP